MSKPRGSHTYYLGETWLEAEEFCYRGGKRRCRALVEGTEKYRIFQVGLCDTFFSFFSVPANLDGKKGFIHLNPDVEQFVFSPCTE